MVVFLHLVHMPSLCVCIHKILLLVNHICLKNSFISYMFSVIYKMVFDSLCYTFLILKGNVVEIILPIFVVLPTCEFL